MGWPSSQQHSWFACACIRYSARAARYWGLLRIWRNSCWWALGWMLGTCVSSVLVRRAPVLATVTEAEDRSCSARAPPWAQCGQVLGFVVGLDYVGRVKANSPSRGGLGLCGGSKRVSSGQLGVLFQACRGSSSGYGRNSQEPSSFITRSPL